MAKGKDRPCAKTTCNLWLLTCAKRACKGDRAIFAPPRAVSRQEVKEILWGSEIVRTVLLELSKDWVLLDLELPLLLVHKTEDRRDPRHPGSSARSRLL